MASLLFGVTTRDPLVFVGVPLLLAGIALAAVWMPAARASRIDPLGAIRAG
jgi:ABC-type lipoprotein release transport system permease subunit